VLIKRALYLGQPAGRHANIIVRESDDGRHRSRDTSITGMSHALSAFEHIAQSGLSTLREGGHNIPSAIDRVVVHDYDLVPNAPGVLI
jgi:hypothetical protein